MLNSDRYPSERAGSLERKLASYSVAAGAALIAAAGADAQPIYTNVDPDYPLPTSPEPPYYVNLNQDADYDLFLQSVALQPALAGKEAGLASGLGNFYVGALSNSALTNIRILGSVSCNYALPLTASACESQVPNCYMYYPRAQSGAERGKAGKVSDIIGKLGYVPYGSYFFRVAGDFGFSPLAKDQGVLVGWEGWFRLRHESNGGTATRAPGDILIVDFAYFDSTPVICSSALPVELISFTAQSANGAISLQWETASESENAGFEIQYRSSKSDAFAAAAFVAGSGTTDEATTYAHTLEDFEPGAYVFRLKQIDFDGSFAYSPEVEVIVEVPGSHYLGSAYPNPFNPSAQFSLVVPDDQSVRIELFDAVGKSVGVLFDGIAEANEPVRVMIDGSDLPSGTYLYRATGSNFSETRTVALLK